MQDPEYGEGRKFPYRVDQPLIEIRDQALKEQFTAFYEANFVAVRNFAYSRIKTFTDAEDITHDAFFKVWKSYWKSKSAPELKRLVFACATNACIDFIRRSEFLSEVQKEFAYIQLNDSTYVKNEHIRAEYFAALYGEIERLPPKSRQIFKMHYFEEKSIAEIAQELGLSIKTVKSQKYRAIELLRKRVRGKIPDTSIYMACLAYVPRLITDLLRK